MEEKAETFLVANKETGLEVNADETKHMITMHGQVTV